MSLADLMVTQEVEKDVIGGFVVPDSGLYNFIIKAAFTGKSPKGAHKVTLHLEDSAGVSHREDIYVTNRAGSPYYKDKQTGENRVMPGMAQINSMIGLVTGDAKAQLGTLVPETKVIKLWDKDAKAEIPTKVEMLTELQGQPIVVGLIKSTVDKNEQNQAGDWVPSGELREEASIRKFFRAADGLTASEIAAGETEAKFRATWDAKYTGQVVNKAEGKRHHTLGAAGAAVAGAPAPAAPTKPLFT